MAVTQRFRWLAGADSSTTHLELKTGQIYRAADVGLEILRELEKAGKLEFIEDNITIEIPRSTLLEVQNGTIVMNDLRLKLEAGIKEK